MSYWFKKGFVLNEIGPEVMEKSEWLFCFSVIFTYRKKNTFSFILNQFFSEFCSSVKSYGFSCCSSLLSLEPDTSVCLSSILRREVLHSEVHWSEIFHPLRSYLKSMAYSFIFCCMQLLIRWRYNFLSCLNGHMLMFVSCLHLLCLLLVISEWSGSLSAAYLFIICF